MRPLSLMAVTMLIGPAHGCCSARMIRIFGSAGQIINLDEVEAFDCNGNRLSPVSASLSTTLDNCAANRCIDRRGNGGLQCSQSTVSMCHTREGDPAPSLTVTYSSSGLVGIGSARVINRPNAGTAGRIVGFNLGLYTGTPFGASTRVDVNHSFTATQSTYNFNFLCTPTQPPSVAPTSQPPTAAPTTLTPTAAPTTLPPTERPTSPPTVRPTLPPTNRPTGLPSTLPTSQPTRRPTAQPTVSPSTHPTSIPTRIPTTTAPTAGPTAAPTTAPTPAPSAVPTPSPTALPTETVSATGSGSPTTSTFSMIVTGIVVIAVLCIAAVLFRRARRRAHQHGTTRVHSTSNPSFQSSSTSKETRLKSTAIESAKSTSSVAATDNAGYLVPVSDKAATTDNEYLHIASGGTAFAIPYDGPSRESSMLTVDNYVASRSSCNGLVSGELVAPSYGVPNSFEDDYVLPTAQDGTHEAPVSSMPEYSAFGSQDEDYRTFLANGTVYAVPFEGASPRAAAATPAYNTPMALDTSKGAGDLQRRSTVDNTYAEPLEGKSVPTAPDATDTDVALIDQTLL